MGSQEAGGDDAGSLAESLLHLICKSETDRVRLGLAWNFETSKSVSQLLQDHTSYSFPIVR